MARSVVPVYGRKCLVCSGKIGARKNANAIYCTPRCKEKAYRDKKMARLRLEAVPESVMPSSPQRKGVIYKAIDENGYAQQIADGSTTIAAVAELGGWTPAGVSRAMGAWRIEEDNRRVQASWIIDPEVEKLLPHSAWDALTDLGIDSEGTDDFEEHMKVLEAAFWKFEHTYFTIGSKQQKFQVFDFHREIIREFIVAQVFATRVLVLTPPRHGKSELVIRFVAWLIMLFPNIQVLWVAATTKLAVAMCRKLKATFEFNEDLKTDFLPPNKKFGDDKAPKWTEDEFTLYTRTDRTLKASTFTAIGSTATVAGRDADFIGVDDLEERKTVKTPDQRQKSKEKHSEIMERQENETGVVTIASRQHIDDIPATLMQQSGTGSWRVHVYSAHDEDCQLDDDKVEGHNNNGCVLMPSIRSYAWLLTMKNETEALTIPGRYELRYLQKAIPVDGMVFDIPLIREQCLDRSRIIGDLSVFEGQGLRLIAGMDPAARGMQAAVLWGWTPTQVYLIDIEVRKGAGQAGAVQLFYEWNEKYGLTHWVYEDNIAKQDFFTRQDVKKAKSDLGLIIENNTTGTNKHDPEVGISSMAPWYHTGVFNLPYGNSESVRKVKLLLSQLQLWTTDGLQRGATLTDVKMASWLPFVKRLQRWSKNDRKSKLVLVSDQSYPNLGGNHAPWGQTNYPGGY